MTLVSICIATYQRVEGLHNLLDSIEAQELPEGVDVEVLVVDNDPPSAESTINTHARCSRFPVRYLSQPEPNISLTRNVAVAAAEGEHVWFVDDDEIADPNCLKLLLTAMDDFQADAVFGPVLPIFEIDVPEWMRPLYDRPIFPTGTRSNAYRTSNTLVRAAALKLVDGPFDAGYGVTGGEDTFLFLQLEAKGLSLIDSSDAVVTEAIPAARATWKWLRSRMRRQGQNYGRQFVAIQEGSQRRVAWMAAKALFQIFLWSTFALANWPNRTRRAHFLMRMWTNIGKIEGVLGFATRRDP